jgi:hypothetical protein
LLKLNLLEVEVAVVLEAVVHLVEVAEATVVARLDENNKISYNNKKPRRKYLCY